MRPLRRSYIKSYSAACRVITMSSSSIAACIHSRAKLSSCRLARPGRRSRERTLQTRGLDRTRLAPEVPFDGLTMRNISGSSLWLRRSIKNWRSTDAKLFRPYPRAESVVAAVLAAPDWHLAEAAACLAQGLGPVELGWRHGPSMPQPLAHRRSHEPAEGLAQLAYAGALSRP